SNRYSLRMSFWGRNSRDLAADVFFIVLLLCESPIQKPAAYDIAVLTFPPERTGPCCGISYSEFPATPRLTAASPRPDAAAAPRPATRRPAHDRYARPRRVRG